MKIILFLKEEREVPGASVRNFAHGKGHEEGGSAYAKAGSSLRRPLFLSIYPQNQSLPTLLLYALTYTSDFTGGYPPPPPTSLCKGVQLGLQIINLLGVTRVSQVKPLCWQTSLCDRIIHTPAKHMIVYYLNHKQHREFGVF